MYILKNDFISFSMKTFRKHILFFSSFYAIYLFSFLVYIQFPYAHNIAADIRESSGCEVIKISNDGDDCVSGNVVHFHSCLQLKETFCPVCTLVSSHYIDECGCIFSIVLFENGISGFSWNTEYYSKAAYQFPDLRAPPSV